MGDNPHEALHESKPSRYGFRLVVVLASIAILAVYFSIVVPRVREGLLHPVWVALPALLGMAGLLAYFSPSAIAERRYKALMKGREEVDDEALLETYFRAEEVARDIPRGVRTIVATHMNYPAEKMLPDDDLMFYWYDLDAVHFILEIEGRFGIQITEADTEHKMFTIREISRLVHRKCAAASTASA